MIRAADIPEFLDEVEKLNPHIVHSHLEQGTEFSTHPYPTSSRYHVDDPNVHLEFGFEEDFGEFLLELDRRIRAGSPSQVLNHYFPPQVRVCNISQITNDKVGMCLEKAAMVALRSSGAPSSHLVKGVLDVQGRTGFHAFNVIGQMPEAPRLADAQHSIIVRKGEERIYYPFNFPLEAFDPDSMQFIFEQPYERQLKWSYHLPRNARLP